MNRPARAARSRVKFTVWMVLVAAACIGFILLGNWQVRRLHWKLGLIHDVATRVHAAPVATPGPDAWPRIADGGLQYLHVKLRGHFLADKQVLVHGPSQKGYGYWVLDPMRTERGFIVWVNRGYIPDSLPGKPGFDQVKAPEGPQTVTGLLRFSEPGGGFLRPNHLAQDQWYSRDVAAMTAARKLPSDKAAPYFVDIGAGQGAHDVPVGGLTKIHFRNSHLGYAITWYLLALGSLLCGGIIIHQHRRSRRTDWFS